MGLATLPSAPVKVPLADITIDQTILLRDADPDLVARYTEAGADVFPPIDLFGDVLADGLHRYRAAQNRGDAEITAIVHPDDRTAAMVFAATANAKHGAPFTRAERNVAIKRLLDLTDWSTRKVADEVGVSQSTVNNIGQGIRLRKELEQHLSRVELGRIDDTKLYRIATLESSEDRIIVAKAAAEIDPETERPVFNEPDIRNICDGIRTGQSARESIDRVRRSKQRYPIDPNRTMMAIIDSMGETTDLLTKLTNLVANYPETKDFVWDIDHGGFVFRDEYVHLLAAIAGLDSHRP